MAEARVLYGGGSCTVSVWRSGRLDFVLRRFDYVNRRLMAAGIPSLDPCEFPIYIFDIKKGTYYYFF